MFQDERKLIVAQGRVYDEEVLYDSIHPVQSRHWHSYSVSVANHHKCTLYCEPSWCLDASTTDASCVKHIDLPSWV